MLLPADTFYVNIFEALISTVNVIYLFNLEQNVDCVSIFGTFCEQILQIEFIQFRMNLSQNCCDLISLCL